MSTPGLTENALLSLKYCWSLNKYHLWDLHFPDRSLNAVEDWITDARRDGLIEQIAWHHDGKRQPSMWHLSDRGEDVIKRLAGNPGGVRRTRPRKVMAHDVRLLDMFVWFVLHTRQQGLCGIRFYREIQLLKGKRKPCMDGLIVLEVGGDYAERYPNLLPWSEGKPLKDETLWRIGLEADNDTEAGQVIADKATNYKTVMADPGWWPYWSERYGPVTPTIAWCAPTRNRAVEISKHWERVWPGGQWLVTSDDLLFKGPHRDMDNKWVIREGGKGSIGRICLAPKEPPAPPAPPAPPSAPAAQNTTPPPSGPQEPAQRSTGHASVPVLPPWTPPPPPAPPRDRPLSELILIQDWRPALRDGEYRDGRPVYAGAGETWVSERLRLTPAEQALYTAYARQERRRHDAQLERESVAKQEREAAEAIAAAARKKQARRDAWRQSWYDLGATIAGWVSMVLELIFPFAMIAGFIGIIAVTYHYGVHPIWPLELPQLPW